MENIRSSESPIFIVGTPRSGTTLTANILDRHPRIFMKGENHFFETIYSKNYDLEKEEIKESVIDSLLNIYGKSNQSEDQERVGQLFSDPENMRRLRNSAVDPMALFRTFMDIQKEAAGMMRWGNNTPKDLFFINDIVKHFPDARILVCVRDPRDFILSYKNRWKVTTAGHASRLRSLYHPILTSLLWKSSMKKISKLEQIVPSENYMVICYEDLVQQPEQVIRKVCGVIGEEYDSQMLQIDSHNSSDRISSRGIFSTSVGKWRKNLESDEIYVAQVITARELKKFGYKLEKTDANISEIIKIILCFPLAVYAALNANKEMRGPLIQYLVRRLTSLVR